MRIPRENHVGIVYHLISRCVNRQWLIRDDEDRALYLRLLGHALAQSDWRCLGYAIMSNHVHLAMVAGRQALGSWLRQVHSPFAEWTNAKYERTGYFFARGPKDYAIHPEREGKVIAYLHRNPVRAGVVRRAADSTWTSHRAYAGLVVAPQWLHVDEGRTRVGLLEPRELDAWVDATPGDGGYVKLEKIRRAAHRRGALEVATPMGGPAPMIPLVARPWGHVRPDPRRIIELTSEVLRIPVEMLCSVRRSPDIMAARKVAVDAAISAGLTATDAAAALGISATGAGKIYRRACKLDEERARDLVLQRLRVEAPSASRSRGVPSPT